MRKKYDWKRLQELLDDETIVDLGAGMAEDISWTYDTVTQEAIDEKSIAGIDGSGWATPVVIIDGKQEDCYTEE